MTDGVSLRNVNTATVTQLTNILFVTVRTIFDTTFIIIWGM